MPMRPLFAPVRQAEARPPHDGLFSRAKKRVSGASNSALSQRGADPFAIEVSQIAECLCCMDIMCYLSEVYSPRPRGLSPKNR